MKKLTLAFALAAALFGCAPATSSVETTTAAEASAAETEALPEVSYRHADIDGLDLFYREAGPKDAPTILLLHGFPSSSHQYRRLIDALGRDYHVIAPDYPGFGFSAAPESTLRGGSYAYTFDHLTDAIEKLVSQLGQRRVYIYMFDFGAPVGFRLALRHPDWVAGIISQNGNAYMDGIGPLLRAEWSLPAEKIPEARRKMLSLEATKMQYLAGASHEERVSPDGWMFDQLMIERPGRDAVLLSLMEDYHTNIEAYPSWQKWLREHEPPTLVVWGKNDPIFVEAGAKAYLRDVPDAELHLLDGAHFAVEEHAPEIATLVARFVDKAESKRR
ncbi:MAG: alpha/beta hydrolase [Polyangiaceae bacterium]|nr:alpha/beta hydrolase [Polyangiaceae bacterium]